MTDRPGRRRVLCCRVMASFEFGKAKHVRNSDNALVTMWQALDYGIDMRAVWTSMAPGAVPRTRPPEDETIDYPGTLAVDHCP